MLERGRRRYYLHRWPSQRAMKRIRQKAKAITGRNRVGIKDIQVVIGERNPVLRGWGNYFRTGNPANKFKQTDDYVAWRLRGLLIKRKGRNLRPGEAAAWTEDWLHGLGLPRLGGTIRYPGGAQAMPRRSKASRVRENRMHGIERGTGKRAVAAPRP
jgi:RNA-directed DNA polymerase